MKFSTGSEVYFVSANCYQTGIFKGVITEEIYLDECDKTYVVLDNVENMSCPMFNCYGTYKAWSDECFLTEDELKTYLKNKYNSQVQRYCSEIKTVEDLIHFPFRYSFNAEEYSNYEAAEAYKIRAKELLNVNVDW